jgi:hypothetical protein
MGTEPGNRDRFWEAAISEVISGHGPPDQRAEILARVHAPEPEPAPTWRGRVFGFAWRVAVAAGVVLAIGWSTGLLPVPWGRDAGPEPSEVAVTEGFVPGPGAEWVLEDGVLRLKSGVVLLGRDAPVVVCGESRLRALEGLALARAGAVPEGADLVAVEEWLKGRTEVEMTTGRWFAGVALAVLMLNGSAILDDTVIRAEAEEGQEQEAAEPIRWHTVETLMDLDNLPEGASYLRIQGRPEILEFLSEAGPIEGLDLRGMAYPTKAQMAMLTKFAGLHYLDIRDVWWLACPDYEFLKSMVGLKTLRADLYALIEDDEGGGLDRSAGNLSARVEVFKHLQQRGVDLSFEAIHFRGDDGVALIEAYLELIPNTRELVFTNIEDDAVEYLARFPNLRRLEIAPSNLSEIGMARIARTIPLEEVVYVGTGWESPQLHFHQLMRIESLKRLEFFAQFQTLGYLDAISKLQGGPDFELAVTVEALSTDRRGANEWQLDTSVLPETRTLTIQAAVRSFRDLFKVEPRGYRDSRLDSSSSYGLFTSSWNPVPLSTLGSISTQHLRLVAVNEAGGPGHIGGWEDHADEGDPTPNSTIKRLELFGMIFSEVWNDDGSDVVPDYRRLYAAFPSLERLEMSVNDESLLQEETAAYQRKMMEALERDKPEGVELIIHRWTYR